MVESDLSGSICEGRRAIPTKRTFDLVVLTAILLHPVVGLYKMWATRKLAVDNTGPVATVTAGALRIVS